jgi:acyl dehydratase
MSAVTGKYFDETQVGMVMRHPITRTVTETDNLLISTLTHNPQPLHLDAEAAAASEFGRILVNSMFTFALMVGLSVGDTSMGTLVANLGFDAVVFPKPVFIGDTLRAETTVLEKRESRSRPTQGIVVYEHRCLNQRGEIVAQCRRSTLIHKRPA